MNYYSHHIGDFDKATRHLTRIERSIYRDLIELYYDTEQPISLDFAFVCRKVIARTNEEVTAVQQVLNEFFTETPTGWFHARCDEEIAAWKARKWFPRDSNCLNNRPPIDEWKATRLRIFQRDNFTCTYCGTRGGDLECDHMTPVSLGGSHADENLTTACKSCNRLKSAKPLDQWLSFIGAPV